MMTGNNQKKPLQWIKIAQFVMFAVSCIAGVMIWFYAQQDRVSDRMAENYVSKYELRLLEKDVEIMKLELRDFKNLFNTRLEKLDNANDAILEMITDVRLTLAGTKND
tara:strand:- start:586 stop:909 length:324 start_codon:yes stop_codon:yes gene_type:complete